MDSSDTLIKPMKVEQLPPVTTIYPETELIQKPKEPNKFLRILGGVAGVGLNMVAPGLGGILGNVINKGGSSYGSYGNLIEQQRQFDEMQKLAQLTNAMNQQNQQTMMNQQNQQSFQLINVQQRVAMQAQEFSTVSNLLKTRHDSEMTAVNNIKS